MKLKSNRRMHGFWTHETSGGLVLILAAFLAMLIANSPWHKIYESIWSYRDLGMSVRHVVNDGLMAIFFLLVGLELKREMREGQLASFKRASFPLFSAIGGMLLPALIYLMFNPSGAGRNGWGIPMATDIAFALGILSLAGHGRPKSLKVFLTAFAMVDDLGAVLIIALFYTDRISFGYLATGLCFFLGLGCASRFRVKSPAFFVVGGVGIWVAFLNSGVHATVAGVLLAFVMPKEAGARLEPLLRPWVAFAIMPLFALANAGVRVSSVQLLLQPVSLGVLLGLTLGKQIGITIFAWIAARLGFAERPQAVRGRDIYALSWLGGIGFTMSLFVANLAFGESPLLSQAKVGILASALLCGLGGALLLKAWAGATGTVPFDG